MLESKQIQNTDKRRRLWHHRTALLPQRRPRRRSASDSSERRRRFCGDGDRRSQRCAIERRRTGRSQFARRARIGRSGGQLSKKTIGSFEHCNNGADVESLGETVSCRDRLVKFKSKQRGNSANGFRYLCHCARRLRRVTSKCAYLLCEAVGEKVGRNAQERRHSLQY